MSRNKWDSAPVEHTGNDVTDFPPEEIRNTWVEFPDCGLIGPDAKADKGRRYRVVYQFAGRQQEILVFARNAKHAEQVVTERDPFDGPTHVLSVRHAPGAKHEDLPVAWASLRSAAPTVTSGRICPDCKGRGYTIPLGGGWRDRQTCEVCR